MQPCLLVGKVRFVKPHSRTPPPKKKTHKHPKTPQQQGLQHVTRGSFHLPKQRKNLEASPLAVQTLHSAETAPPAPVALGRYGGPSGVPEDLSRRAASWGLGFALFCRFFLVVRSVWKDLAEETNPKFPKARLRAYNP